MRARRFLPYVLVFLAALPGLVFTLDPAGRDQGVFALIGWRWFQGDVPYLSAGMEHKGPLPFLAYGLSFILFGHSFLAARLMAWLGLLIAGWGLVFLGRRMAETERPGDGTAVGAVAGISYVLITGVGGLSTWWSGAQAESFMEPFVVWAVALMVRSRSTRSLPAGRVFIAGVLLGAASLGKPTVLILGPLLLMAGVNAPGAAALVAGVVTPWLATLAWFGAHHAAGALIESVFTANIDYGSRGVALLKGIPARFLPILDQFVNLRFLVPALLGAAMLPRRNGAASRLLFAWTIAALIEVIVQGRLFGYHFYPIVAPVSVLAGFGFVVAWRSLPALDPRRPSTPARSARRPWPGIFAAGVLVVGASGLLSLDWNDWRLRWEYASGHIPEVAFLRSFAAGENESDVNPYETMVAARWAAGNLKPDDTLLVWGFEPAVNFLARRRSPTRFIYDYFLTSKSIDPKRQRHYWDLFWDDLAAHPPDWIAVVHGDKNPIEPEDSATQLRKDLHLRIYLDEGYESEARVGDFEFYRRIDESGSTPGG